MVHQAQALQFSRLRVSGFKSFSEPCALELRDGLTGIVGPNGCGKSNIVEALRWVMGESSARGLRGSEMEDIIFGGSALRPPHDLAEVALALVRPLKLKNGHAGNGKGNGASAPFNGHDAGAQEDLEIVRRIARGTGSSFRLNGREARSRDIQLLFADAGSGARSPAIIGQGRVAFVVEAKPEERRRLLEDAAGIGGLHSRRHEAELKLTAARRNLERLLDQLRIKGEQAASLRRQTREAERYRTLQGELRELEAASRYAGWAAVSCAHEAALRACEEALAAHEAALAGRKQAAAERAAAASTREQLRVRLEAAHEAQVAAAQALATAETRAEVRNRERQRLDQSIAETEALLKATRERLEAAATRRSALGVELAGLERREKALLGSIAEDESELSAREGAAQSAAEEVSGLGQRKAALDAACAGLRARIDEQDKRRRQLMSELERLGAIDEEALVDVAQRKLEASARALAECATDLERRQSALPGHEEAEKRAREAQARLESELRGLDEAVERLRAELRSAEVELHHLDERSRLHTARLSKIIEELTLLAEEEAELRQAEAADPAMLSGALERAQDDLSNASHRLAAVKGEQEQAVAQRQALLMRTQAIEQDERRLEAELAGLQALQGETADTPLLDEIAAPEELRTALAAVLGDDLLLGRDGDAGAHWRDLPGDPPAPALPEGAVALITRLSLPPLLEARFARLGLVEDEATGDRLQPLLAPGQRLVSRGGAVWRWDGLIRRALSEDPARARVEQRQRLRACREQLEDVARQCADAQRELSDLESLCEALAASLRQASEAEGVARQALAAAGEEKERAERVDEERASRLKQVGDMRAALETESAEHEAALAAIESQRHGLDLRSLEGQLEELGQAREQTRHRLAQGRAASEEVGRLCEEARAALDKARESHLEAQRVHALAEATFERRQSEAELRRSHKDTAESSLRRELETLEQELERAGTELAQSAPEQASLEEALRDARARQGEAVEACRKGRAALADAKAECQQVQVRAGEAGREQVRLESEALALDKEKGRLKAALEELASRYAEDAEPEQAQALETLRETRHSAEAELACSREALEEAEAVLVRTDEAARAAEAAVASAHEAMVLAESEKVRLARSLAELQGDGVPRAPADAELRELSEEALAVRIDKLKAARDRLGPVNLRAAFELEQLAPEIAAAEREQEELEAAIERLSRAIQTLDREARGRLQATFEIVDRHFKELFKRLFGGGEARLRLVDGDDPVRAGLELEAMPPGKKLARIGLLSGGEKSLAALALIFAFFMAEPSPLCVLDEVDAALDDANVERFVNLMEEIARSTGTRFLVVTHHPLTMARMDRLFGVTMIERGVSRIVSVALDEATSMVESAAGQNGDARVVPEHSTTA